MRLTGDQWIARARARLVDEHACDDEPPGWATILGSILRLVAPFI